MSDIYETQIDLKNERSKLDKNYKIFVKKMDALTEKLKTIPKGEPTQGIRKGINFFDLRRKSTRRYLNGVDVGLEIIDSLIKTEGYEVEYDRISDIFDGLLDDLKIKNKKQFIDPLKMSSSVMKEITKLQDKLIKEVIRSNKVYEDIYEEEHIEEYYKWEKAIKKKLSVDHKLDEDKINDIIEELRANF